MMKERLKAHTDCFSHPFPADPDPFHCSAEFDQRIANTEAIGVDHIPWYHNANTTARVWPPKLS